MKKSFYTACEMCGPKGAIPILSLSCVCVSSVCLPRQEGEKTDTHYSNNCSMWVNHFMDVQEVCVGIRVGWLGCSVKTVIRWNATGFIGIAGWSVPWQQVPVSKTPVVLTQIFTQKQSTKAVTGGTPYKNKLKRHVPFRY